MEEYFRYGETELSHLRRQDERLAEVIDRVGMVKRRVIPDLFAALVHTIVGQQISTRAHETIWQRIQAAIGPGRHRRAAARNAAKPRTVAPQSRLHPLGRPEDHRR